MNQPDTAMVHRSVIVEAPIERAFAVFTGRFGDFKPPEHNMLGVPIAETVFETHVGGHIYDRGRTAASVAGPGFSRSSLRTGSSSAGTSARKPIPTTPAKSRSGSSPKPHSAPDSTSNTATSNDTDPAGKVSATVSPTTPDGPCTSTATPTSSRPTPKHRTLGWPLVTSQPLSNSHRTFRPSTLRDLH